MNPVAGVLPRLPIDPAPLVVSDGAPMTKDHTWVSEL